MKRQKREPKAVRIKSTGQVFPFRYAYYNEERKCVLVVIDAGSENLAEADEFPMHYLEPIY